jgi:hypothetical protein
VNRRGFLRSLASAVVVGVASAYGIAPKPSPSVKWPEYSPEPFVKAMLEEIERVRDLMLQDFERQLLYGGSVDRPNNLGHDEIAGFSHLLGDAP